MIKTQMIDKSNFDERQYRADLDSAYECGRASVLSAIDGIKAEIRHKQWYLGVDNANQIIDLIDKAIGEVK